MEEDSPRPDEKPKGNRILRIVLWTVAATGVSGLLFELASIVSFLYTMKQVEGMIGQ